MRSGRARRRASATAPAGSGRSPRRRRRSAPPGARTRATTADRCRRRSRCGREDAGDPEELPEVRRRHGTPGAAPIAGRGRGPPIRPVRFRRCAVHVEPRPEHGASVARNPSLGRAPRPIRKSARGVRFGYEKWAAPESGPNPRQKKRGRPESGPNPRQKRKGAAPESSPNPRQKRKGAAPESGPSLGRKRPRRAATPRGQSRCRTRQFMLRRTILQEAISRMDCRREIVRPHFGPVAFSRGRTGPGRNQSPGQAFASGCVSHPTVARDARTAAARASAGPRRHAAGWASAARF